MIRRLRYSTVAVVMLLFVSAQASDFVSHRLKAKEANIKSVVLLPPIVNENKRGVKGVEGMGKEADTAATELASGVAAALTSCGFSVERPFTEEALKGNDELKYALADVQKRFDDIAPQLYEHHKDVRMGRFTLGDLVAVLNTKGTADALVIVRATGSMETKGKSFMTGGLLGMAMSGTPTFRSTVALVDAKNGDILFLGDYISRGLPKDKTYEKSFKNIPVSK